jgi:uncharacterized membrane protein
MNMAFIAESWRGERPLALVFWGYYIGFYLASFFLIIALVLVVPEQLRPLFLIPVGLLLLPYHVWILVSIWRCAKTSRPIVKIVARVWVVMFVVAGVGKIAASSMESYQYYSNKAKRQTESQRSN